MRYALILAASAGALAALPFVAVAQTHSATALTAADKQFIMQAGHGNAAEIAAGGIAAQKATAPAVQEFGRWMQADHTAASHQLAAVAAASHASAPPMQPDQQQQQMAQRLQQASGTSFDQTYIQGMVTDHQHDLQQYQQEQSSTHNRLLRGYVTATIPIIQAHLAEAQQLSAANPMTASASGTGTTTVK